MFETPQKKTELVIVCDDKRMKYAKYLVQLVGRKDDSAGTTVGTEDGTVSAAIFTEKQYKETLSKITSNTHILFIGRNKTTKEEARFIDWKIDCFGMKYGRQGKRAVMLVDEGVKKGEYDAFVEYAKSYQLEYQQKVADTNIVAALEAIEWALLPPVAIYSFIKRRKARKEMKEQQYRCLVLAVYMDELQSFLEE